MNLRILETCVLLIILSIMSVRCYKPVMIIHGIFAGSTSMKFLKTRIETAHPGTKVNVIDRYNGVKSVEKAWNQVNDLVNDLKIFCNENPDGVHLVGFSQGGLMARVLLELYPEHNVKSFVSLSSPQAGQYGLDIMYNYLKERSINFVNSEAYEFLYSKVGQEISVANYWRDPNRLDRYLKGNSFLPYVNNEIITENSTNYRKGITNLSKMILIGGPDDGIISPWQSAHFEFYEEKFNYVRPLKLRDIYIQDSIGLRELNEQGKLFVYTRSKISHHHWHENAEVIDELILPHLD